MKKTVFLFAIFHLISVSSDCFAQSSEVRARALQGEWLLISIGDFDLKEPPYSEIGEAVWIFEENHYLLKLINFQTGEIEAQSGTFKIIADGIILSHQDGTTQTGTFSLQENTLTVNIERTRIILIKR